MAVALRVGGYEQKSAWFPSAIPLDRLLRGKRSRPLPFPGSAAILTAISADETPPLPGGSERLRFECMAYRQNSILLLLSMVLFISFPAFVLASSGDLSLSVPVFDSTITLQARAKFAGAVSSLVFRGTEHIDSLDPGRLLQSASSFDGYGECYNPTEGGASHESQNENVSVLKAARVEGNQLWTLVDMGFWLNPGQAYPNGCGTRKTLTQAINTEPTSGHLLEKRLTVGLPGFPNVIEHQVTFYVPTNFSSATFEASTGYIPKEFSRALYYDAEHGTEIDPGNRQGEQAFPVILATPDNFYAIGVYSPQLPKNGMGYGRFSFPDVNKWNCVFREDNVKHANQYNYQCLIILGTLNEVEDTLRRLDKTYGHISH